MLLLVLLLLLVPTLATAEEVTPGEICEFSRDPVAIRMVGPLNWFYRSQLVYTRAQVVIEPTIDDEAQRALTSPCRAEPRPLEKQRLAPPLRLRDVRGNGLVGRGDGVIYYTVADDGTTGTCLNALRTGTSCYIVGSVEWKYTDSIGDEGGPARELTERSSVLVTLILLGAETDGR